MLQRRGVEPLEPQLGSDPLLHRAGGETAGELPSLCADLKRARMTAGYELTDIASALRIRLVYLEALEEGRFGDLPGTTYATGFLRSYCEYLRLDSEEMVERLKRETTSGTVRRDLTFPVPPKEGRNPKPWLVLIVLLLAGLAYGGWYVYSTEGQIATNLVSDVSNKLTEAAGLSNDEDVMAAVATEAVATEDEAGEAQSSVSSKAAPTEAGIEKFVNSEQNISTTPEAVSVQTDVVGAEAGAALTSPDVARDAASSTTNSRPLRSDSLWDNAARSQPDASAATLESALPQSGEAVPIIRNANAQSMEGEDSEEFDVASSSSDATDMPARRPSIFGEENADFRIAIRATADSWVEIQGPNNELLLTRILRTGEIYQVPNRSGLIMVTGNAGALEVRVDGAVVDALGPIGVVRRNVSLDPETLVAGSEADH
ncbi:MAG: DUF4115 domain-containing protein [Proteobacteria bacterium]|nr:DUF4115 domain-containing protein [Pseudomonadota bacterium]MDA1356686.1 DUF4115 domain-containing protein [Pseudomonadota bacterium]